MDPEQLRRQAAHFRQLASHIIDDRAYEAAIQLAREYDELAATVDHHGRDARGEDPTADA